MESSKIWGRGARKKRKLREHGHWANLGTLTDGKEPLGGGSGDQAVLTRGMRALSRVRSVFAACGPARCGYRRES